MKALFMLSILGFIVFMSFGLWIWWKAGYTQAYVTLDEMRVKQIKALHFLPKQPFLKPWGIKTSSLKRTFLKDSPMLQRAATLTIYQSIQLLNLSMLAAQCVLMKLMILITAIPLLSITMLMGVVDGLSQRAIRTASLGRESAYLFHQLKKQSKRTMAACVAFWLLLPLSIAPAFIFIPMSIVMGLLTAATVAHFKKYY